MKRKVSFWNINFEEFYKLKTEKDKLKFIIQLALLAPSSHNCQPWKIKIDGDDKIIVYPNLKKSLKFSDKINRQLYLSLGCFFETILIAANHFGFNINVKKNLDSDGELYIFYFGKVQQQTTKNNLAEQITRRRTNRFKYTNEALPQQLLEDIKFFENENNKVFIVNEKKDLDIIADVVVESGVKAMSHKEFRSELFPYVKSNYTRSMTVIPLYGFGMPGAVSLIAPLLIRTFNMNKVSQKKDLELLKNYTPAFGVIFSSQDNKDGWIESGRLYQRIALQASKYSVYLAPNGAVIEFGQKEKLSSVCGTNFYPQIFFRIGHSKVVPKASPRMNFDTALIN